MLILLYFIWLAIRLKYNIMNCVDSFVTINTSFKTMELRLGLGLVLGLGFGFGIRLRLRLGLGLGFDI